MKNKLVLKSLSCDEIESLKYWEPKSLSDVYLSLVLEIGFSGEIGVNIFYVTLATPEALRKNCNGFEIVKNRTLVVSDYNYSLIQKMILEILDNCNRNGWDECCIELQKYFYWEFEHYQLEE